VTPQVYKSWWSPSCTLASSRTFRHSLLATFPTPKNKEGCKEEKREKRKEKRKKGEYWDLESFASPSSSSHGKTGLDPFHGYVGSPAKAYKTRVYDGGRARDVPCAR
jgi:hypothetical protein